MAGYVSLSEINRGDIDLTDILKLNAILDAREAAEAAAADAAKSN